MGLGIGLACCCECPGFCNDISRATILITLKGIAGTPFSCASCDALNQTYPLTYRTDSAPYYSLQCAPYEDMVTACLYAVLIDTECGRVYVHLWAYTTAGGDRRGYLEVRFVGAVQWIQKRDFLFASGSTSLNCLAFTLEDEPLEYCSFIGVPGSDCAAATAIDLSIAAA